MQDIIDSQEKLEELIGKNDAKTTLRAIFN